MQIIEGVAHKAGTDNGERVYISKDMQAEHPNAFFLRVQDDSADKLLPVSCYALVDPDSDQNSGDLLAVNVNGDEAIIRRVFFEEALMVLHPESYNPAHKARSIDISDPDEPRVRIIGKVVWHVMPVGFRY